MIIHLWGPNSYSRKEKFNEILAQYKNKYPIHDLLYVDCEEEGNEGWIKAKNFLDQASMFTQSKMLVLFEAARSEWEEWVEFLKNQLENSKIFVVISDSNEPDKEFKFLLSPPVRSQKFLPLTAGEFEVFVKKITKQYGINFSPHAFHFFINRFNSVEKSEKQWQVRSELHKLSLFFKNKIIDEKELQLITRNIFITDIYGLTRVILSRNNSFHRMTALEEAISTNVDPARLFNTLCFMVKGKQALLLAEEDIKIKSGVLDYETALTETTLLIN